MMKQMQKIAGTVSPAQAQPTQATHHAPRHPPRCIWLLSPYHTGSHRAWAEGLADHSRHTVRMLTLEGRFWKWRMQGGAVDLARVAAEAIHRGDTPDLVLATDMVNLPAWLAMMRHALPPSCPVMLYMHENQLTYPWRPGEKPDLTYAVINWLSQLNADCVAFNSQSHLDAWFAELPRLLKHFPDYSHLPMMADVRARSLVLPVGISAPPIERSAEKRGDNRPPLILWNQRWEYDKRPDRFFALLYRLQRAGVHFRLAVAGENFRNAPSEFDEARDRLRERIVWWGFVENRADYAALLKQADLVVSTADHEFFGISILEAVAAGALPLLPQRLSYPELIPPQWHGNVLYSSQEDLYQKALTFLQEPDGMRAVRTGLQTHVCTTYSWPAVATLMDDEIERVILSSANRHMPPS